jgi:hypothetical protein
VLASEQGQVDAQLGLAVIAHARGIESRLRQLLANRQSGPLHFALGNLLAQQERWSDAQQEYFAAATLAPATPCASMRWRRARLEQLQAAPP